MTLNSIVVNFDSAKEQRVVEKKAIAVGIRVMEHETYSVDDPYTSWTEFDISGCTVDDLAEVFAEEQ